MKYQAEVCVNKGTSRRKYLRKEKCHWWHFSTRTKLKGKLSCAGEWVWGKTRRKNRSFEKSGMKERVMSWEAAGNRHYRVLFILLRKLEFVPLSLGASTFLHRSMISWFLWNRWVTLVRVWSGWVMFGNTLAVGNLFGSLLTHSPGWRGQRLSIV